MQVPGQQPAGIIFANRTDHRCFAPKPTECIGLIGAFTAGREPERIGRNRFARQRHPLQPNRIIQIQTSDYNCLFHIRCLLWLIRGKFYRTVLFYTISGVPSNLCHQNGADIGLEGQLYLIHTVLMVQFFCRFNRTCKGFPNLRQGCRRNTDRQLLRLTGKVDKKYSRVLPLR